MSYTRQQFCVALLNALGNKIPTQNTVNFMIGWSLEESGHNLAGAARYNLWNTTQKMPGSTFYNTLSPGVGVQNYTSFAQGIQANAQTLNNGLYPSLIRALQTNNEAALGFQGPMSAGVQGDLSVWVNGQRTPIALSYIQAISYLSKNVGNSGAETAPGTATGGTGPVIGPGTPIGGQKNGTGGTTQPPTVNLGGDVNNLFSSIGALFGANNQVVTPNILDQVHQTLVDTPGFYGIALALDEAEQFPGFINVTSGPFDFVGGVRSVGATIGDNAIPFFLRAGLVSFGVLIIALLLIKMVAGVTEQVAPLVEAAALAA